MGSFARLQSDIVRTGGNTYQFLAENDVAYLQTVATRLGFGFRVPEGQSGEIPLACFQGSYTYEEGTSFDNSQAIKISKSNFTTYINGTHTVSANKEYTSWPAWKAFNGDTTQYWWDSDSPPFILTYDFGQTVTVSSYKLAARSYEESNPGVWTFEYSADGVTWQVGHDQNVRQSYAISEYKTFVLPVSVIGRYFRWVITQNNTGSVYDNMSVGDAEIWGALGAQGVILVEGEGSITTLYLDAVTGKLKVLDWEGVVVAETTQTFAADAWHYLEFTNGELRHNGNTIATWTPIGTTESLRLGLVEPATAEFYADDIVVSTGDDWYGPVRCHLLQPNEDLEETGWDRLPADAPTAHSTLTDADDASYLYSQQGLLRVGLQDLADNNEILAVQVMSRLSVDAEGETDVDLLLDETIVDTQTLTTTPAWYTHIASVNPTTDTAWTAAEINALGVGWMMVAVPDAPANLAVTQQTEDPANFDVSFNPPAYTGGAAIIEYEVEADDGSTQTVQTGAASPISFLSMPYVTYDVRARARNLKGWSAWTTPIGYTHMSPTGVNWISRSSPADNQWTDITYGNGLFVAIARTGTGNRVMTSPDGITWTLRTTPADNAWQSVTYGNGLFVAVAFGGSSNRVMTSPDGITWTIRTSAANNGWYGVTYGNGLFVAVSYDGTSSRVMTSPNGITWTNRSSSVSCQWRSITYGNGLFVAVGNSGGGCVMTSPDGITWTTRYPYGYAWMDVTYGNGLFVAVAYTGTGTRVQTSPDGINWTLQTTPADNNWFGITYGDGLFVATAGSGTNNRVMTSPDGVNWTIRTTPADNEWRSVAYGNGMFVTVSETGVGNRVMTSGTIQDGIT